VDGIEGVALGWPSQFEDGAQVKALLASVGLRLSTVEPDIYSDARFKHGSLTNRDAGIRRESVAIIKAAIDAALAGGAHDLSLWLAQDGFDYVFSADYASAWGWLLDGLAEVADHNPVLPISLEPKGKEPRANQYVSGTGRGLYICAKVDRPHFGLALDYGHCLAALESPAESAALALREGRLQQVHLNDNYRDWDHDLVPGAATVWDHVEFFYWLRKLGYDGWCSVDVFPYREDGAEALAATVQVVRTCCALAERLEAEGLEELVREGRHLEVLRRLWGRLGDG
jgi:xylose isomerase